MKHLSLQNLPLRVRLLLTVLLPLILIFILILSVLSFGLRNSLEKAAESVFLENTVAGATEVSQSLEHVQDWLRNISHFSELQKQENADVASLWLREHYLDIPMALGYSYAKINDKNLVIDNKTHKIKEVNFRDREYYKAVLRDKTHEFYISKPLLSRARQKWIVVCSHAVKNLNNEVDAMLSLSVDIEKLVNYVVKSQENTSEENHLWLIDGEGRFISDNHELAKNQATLEEADKAGFIGLSALKEKLLKQEQGYLRLPQSKKIVVWSAVKNTPGWKYGRFLPTSKVDDMVFSMLFFLVIIMVVGIIILIIIFFYAIQQQMTPVVKSLELAKTIASLDFTQKIDDKTLKAKDELGDLAKSMNQMSNLLRKMIHDIRISSNYVSLDSQELNKTSQVISQTASQQAANLEEVATAVVQITGVVKKYAGNSLHTEEIAKRSSRMAEESSTSVLQTVESMKQISEKTSIIQEIAGQTRLLSLNASIEAARAGNTGKGFAVVAQEVSKLAELSSSAASEIETLISASVQIANTAGDKLKSLLPEIKETVNLVEEITASGKEQELSIEQISFALQEVNSVVQSNANFSEKLADAAANLENSAEQLKEIISRFKI